jgi:hypothetical protein
MLRELLESLGIEMLEKPFITVPEEECSVNEKSEWEAGAIAAV